MTYQETIDYLFSRLASYQHQGTSALNYKLENITKFCEYLGNPQNEYKIIHVGGTNGKGTTSHMLSAVLQQSGFKTGLYTSPHLKQMNERFKVNGEEVSNSFITDFVAKHFDYIENTELSFFELTVGLTFGFFKKEKVDFAIVEVGLGGRFDSTNIVNPILSVITNVSLDHVAILGDTLEKIAFEKAGIIKNKVPVVIGEGEVLAKVAKAKAKEIGTSLILCSDLDGFDAASIFNTYELKNLKTTLASVGVLRELGIELIDDVGVIRSLINYKMLTGFKGRWQQIRSNPKAICDVGHNEAGIRDVVAQFDNETYESLHVVWGMVNDKDVSKVVELLPKEAKYVLCESKNPRALSVFELEKVFTQKGLSYVIEKDVQKAYALALKNAKKEDLIFVGGSTFVVGELDEV